MKTDKKALLAYVEQHGWKYPKGWIIVTYSFVGSLIGAFIVGIFFIIPDFVRVMNHWQVIESKDFISIIFAPILIAFVGWVFGIIPAFLTGLYIGLNKFVITDKRDYWQLFYIGVLSTALYGTGFLLYNDIPTNRIGTILAVIGLLVLGGISSVICGKWFVPRFSQNS